MKCRHLKIHTTNIQQMGLSATTEGKYLCSLKMQSKEKQIEIYQTLFEKKIREKHID